MSDVAAAARRLATGLLPQSRTRHPPDAGEIEAALELIGSMRPEDAHDEAALQEAGETLLRLLESVRAHGT